MFVDNRSGPLFPIIQMTLLWQPITRKAVVRYGLEYRSSDSKLFNGNISATFSADLMNINPVTPDISRVKPVITFWTIRQTSEYLTESLRK